MKKMNDPIENAINGFRNGVADARIGRTDEPKLQPWAKGILYFCLAVVVAAGGLGLYVQLTQ